MGEGLDFLLPSLFYVRLYVWKERGGCDILLLVPSFFYFYFTGILVLYKTQRIYLD